MLELLVAGSMLTITLLLIVPDRQPHNKLIKQWSSLFHLKVKYTSRYSESFEVDIHDNEMYISRYNKGTHDRDEYIYSIAHEFGHLIDHAYREYYNKEERDGLSAKAILREEQRAWKIAKVLLESNNIYDKKKFDSLKNRCLEDYKKALKLK